MKAKKIVAAISALVLLISGVWAVIHANTLPRTYSGSADAVTLYEEAKAGAKSDLIDPEMAEFMATEETDIIEPDGVAEIIVRKNLTETMAQNNVAAIVFDFRGFDTLGESFILLTAIAGSFVILSKSHKKKKKEDEE